MVWMDERPLDPARVYLLKHTTRTVTARRSIAPLVLNQIGSGDDLDGAAADLRPLRRESRHGQLHPDRSGDELHGRRRHDRRCRSAATARPSRAATVAERLAQIARAATSEREAVDAVRQALEEILT